MSLLAIPAVLGWALLVSRRLPGRPGAAIFLAVSSVLAAVYLFACAGALPLGAFLLFYGGGGALLASLWRSRSDALRFLGSVPCGVFVACGVAYGLAFSDYQYFYWDEFSQWGLVTREMMATNALYDLASNARRPTAPPGAALWHYFVCANTGYSEGATYVAQFLLASSALLPLYDGLSWRRPGWIALTAAVELLLLLNLGNGVASLYVDQLLSCFFGGILLVHLAQPASRSAVAWLAAPLFALSLIKEPALFFAGSAAALVALHHLLATGRDSIDGIRRLRHDRRTMAALCLVLAAPLLAVGSWQLRLATLESETPPRSVWGTGARVLGGFGQETGFEKRVVARFAEVFLEQPMSRSEASEQQNAFLYPGDLGSGGRFRFSTLGWLLCFAVVSGAAWACARSRDRKRAIALTSCALLVVFAAYVASLLRVYVTGGESGMRLSSYVRYVNTALLPMLLVAAAWFLPATSAGQPDARSQASAPVLLAVLAVLYAVETPNFEPLTTTRPVQPFRTSTQTFVNRIVSEIGPGHSIFVYTLPEYRWAPMVRRMLRYQLTPLAATVQPSLPDDDALRAALGHDYLWIFDRTHELTARFRSAYGSRPPQGGVVYRVDRHAGALELVPILARSGPEGGVRFPVSLRLAPAPPRGP